MVSKKTPANGYSPLSIGVGLAGMWLLGMAGVHLLHHFNPHHFVFIDQMEETERNLLILKHYLFLIIVQVPAIYWAAHWFRSAAFARPSYQSFVLVFGLHIVLLTARSFDWPWPSFVSVNQFVPLIAELIYILVIAAITALITFIFNSQRISAKAEMQA